MAKTFMCCSRVRLLGCCLGFALVWMVSAKIFAVWENWASPETIQAGRELFEHEWQPNDPLAAEGDGLGPVFNAKSCVKCHFQGGVGGAGTTNVLSFEALPTAASPKVHGGVVHAFATSADLKESPASVRDVFPIAKNGIRVNFGCSSELSDFDPVQYAQVNPPALFGSRFIDHISDWSIRLNGMNRTNELMMKEIQSDFSGTPVGRVRVLPDGRIGKFGWKAQFATVEEFVAAACAVELGLTNPLQSQDVARQHKPDRDAKHDLDKKQFGALVSFVRHLPAPTQVLPTEPDALTQVERGEAMFAAVGCADCHTPNLGGVKGIYSDLRLHRIEDTKLNAAYVTVEPVVPVPVEHPLVSEWKTPPLWGVADSAPYFHDGSAPTLESAILRHSSQAGASRTKFKALPDDDQAALVAFLKTLRAPEAKE